MSDEPTYEPDGEPTGEPTGGPARLGELELDELLSAELDGELGAVAADLGLGLDEVTARIRATPGADERRSALAAARDVLGEVPEIDELLAARLRAKAMRTHSALHAQSDAVRRRRGRRIFATAGGIAAAIAVIAGIAVAGGQHGGKESASSKAASAPLPSTSAAPERTPAAAGAPNASAQNSQRQAIALRPVLGPFTDARTLALAAVSRAQTSGTDLSPAFDRGSGQFAASATSAPAANSTESNGAPKTLEGGVECAAPPQVVDDHDTLTLRASATLSGEPVNVSVYAGAGEHVVVIEDLDCKLVNLQMMS
jgi:hypothetical protein